MSDRRHRRAGLDAFRDMYVQDGELKSRISELLWLDVYGLLHALGVHPFEMLDTIYELEQGSGSNGTKPAAPFKNMPLKGLWHKHYFSAHFLPKNISLGLGKNGAMRIIKEVIDSNESPDEMIGELSRRIVREPFEQRSTSKQLTGEWLIYLPYNGKNHYLCCSTHDAGDQAIYDRIIQHCIADFPDLLHWLAAAQAAPQT